MAPPIAVQAEPLLQHLWPLTLDLTLDGFALKSQGNSGINCRERRREVNNKRQNQGQERSDG
jgi:hypothetical protein